MIRLAALPLAVDALLIGRVFQPLVDRLQRRPDWLAAHSMVLSVLLGVLAYEAFIGWSVTAALIAALGGIAVLVSLVAPPLLQAALRSRPLRMAWMLVHFLDLLLAALVVALGGGLDQRVVAVEVGNLAFMAALYFAACQPPGPPRRRRAARLSPSGGQA